MDYLWLRCMRMWLWALTLRCSRLPPAGAAERHVGRWRFKRFVVCWATGLGSSGQARVTVALACGSVPARTRAAWVGGAKGERFRSARWRRGVSGRAGPWPRRLATRAGGYCGFPVQLFIPPDAGAAAWALRQRLVPAPVNSNVGRWRHQVFVVCLAAVLGSSGQARVTVALACGSVPARTRAAWAGGAKGSAFGRRAGGVVSLVGPVRGRVGLPHERGVIAGSPSNFSFHRTPVQRLGLFGNASSRRR
jgi:hypothetical protein